MVLESDNGQYASLLTVPRRGVDTRRCASKGAGSKGGGFGGGPTSIGRRKECPSKADAHISWEENNPPL